jgi:hypothetical protein
MEVAADVNSVKMYVAKAEDFVWIYSQYGGLVLIDLSSKNEAFAPEFFSAKSSILAQHPQTGELLHLEGKNLFLKTKTKQTVKLCELQISTENTIVDMAFLGTNVYLLDETDHRIFAFDLKTGVLISSNSHVGPAKFAACNTMALPLSSLLVWGNNAGFQSFSADPIAKIQSQLSPSRAVSVAQLWNCNRMAAWRLLDDGSAPEKLAQFTASPALSVALLGA